MKKEHNGIISFWKFMFSLMIIALHLGFLHSEAKYNFSGGSIGVDFFFLVSGCLFCKKVLSYKKIENDLGKESANFILKKIKRFLPYILFLWAFSVPYGFIVEKYRLWDFISGFYNLLYLSVSNIKIYDFYGITWYIVSMIIVESILFPILIKYRKNFIYIFSPLIVFFGINYLYIRCGTIAATWTRDIFCYGGIVRGFTIMNLGLIIYLVSEKLKMIRLSDFSKFILTLIEIIGYLSIFIICNKSNSHIRFDCLMIILMSISIIISFSKQSLLYEFSNNKLFFFLEKISLPIYINQWALIYMIEYFLKKLNITISYYKELLLIIVISMAFAYITILVINFIQKRSESIKKVFINE
ncbi:MAG: hypothetical protein J6O56_04990 [Bacilli bacterium]|nr:hypothetical protein [Bacilli bacterium]